MTKGTKNPFDAIGLSRFQVTPTSDALGGGALFLGDTFFGDTVDTVIDDNNVNDTHVLNATSPGENTINPDIFRKTICDAIVIVCDIIELKKEIADKQKANPDTNDEPVLVLQLKMLSRAQEKCIKSLVDYLAGIFSKSDCRTNIGSRGGTIDGKFNV